MSVYTYKYFYSHTRIYIYIYTVYPSHSVPPGDSKRFKKIQKPTLPSHQWPDPWQHARRARQVVIFLGCVSQTLSSEFRRVKPQPFFPCQVAVSVMKIGPRLGWVPYTKFLASSHGKCIMAMDAGTRNHKEQPGTEEPASCHHTTVLEHVEPLGFQTSGAGWVPSPVASSNHMKKNSLEYHPIQSVVNQSVVKCSE